MATQFVQYPSPTITASNPSVGTAGSPIPTSDTLVGAKDGSGNLQPLNITAGGALKTDASATTQPISGTVAATQSGTWTVQPGNTANTTAWKVDGSAVTQPISGTVTANAGTNLNTSLLALDTSVNGILLSQGSTTSGQKGVLHLGAVTTAAPSYTTAQTSPLSLDTSGLLRVSLKDTPANTNKILVTADPITFASAQAVTQSGTWSTRTQDGSGTAITSTASALDVNIKTSSITINTAITGLTSKNKARNDYSSVNVTTAAYVQLIASTSATIQNLDIFDSSGQTLVLATGAAASEVDQIYIYPGGNGLIPLQIASGTRVSIKAVSATASAGEIDINFLG